MDEQKMDLGEMKSRDIGNMTKTLVELGAVTASSNADGQVDYGKIPSRAVTELGKKILAEQNNQ